MNLKTIKIVQGDSYIVINESDYDDKRHEVWKEKAEPKAKQKAKPKAVKKQVKK